MYQGHVAFHAPADEAAALAEQDRLRGAVEPHGPLPRPLRYVAGLDVAYATDETRVAGAVAVLDIRTLELVDSATAHRPVEFPYIPGLLAFREIPALLDALERLTVTPDVLVCDGYGLAHPRRFGLACHLGVLTGLPTFGVAKTPFIGSYQEPGTERGAASDLVDVGEGEGFVPGAGVPGTPGVTGAPASPASPASPTSPGVSTSPLESLSTPGVSGAPGLPSSPPESLTAASAPFTSAPGLASVPIPIAVPPFQSARSVVKPPPEAIIGRVLRTQSGIKPVFISIGHRIGLDEATSLTLRLAPSSPGFRLPETTRRSDQLSRQALAEIEAQSRPAPANPSD